MLHRNDDLPTETELTRIRGCKIVIITGIWAKKIAFDGCLVCHYRWASDGARWLGTPARIQWLFKLVPLPDGELDRVTNPMGNQRSKGRVLEFQ